MAFETSHGDRSRRRAARPELNQLAIFLKVVETRSFAGSARELGRTQPAISQAIARLEEIFGGDLFVRRRGASLALTPIGEAILPSARIVIDAIDEQMTRAVATAQSREGHLTVGFFQSLASGRLRAGLAAFHAAGPDIRLRMVEALPGELYRQLNERAIDLMLGAALLNHANAMLVQEPLWDERLVVALPAQHELAANARLSLAEIAALPILVREAYPELVIYRTLLDHVDRQVQVEQHAVSCQTLLDMVGIGLGAAIIFTSAAVPHHHVVFRAIADESASVPIVAIYPKNDANPLRHRLLRLIREASPEASA